MSRRRLILFTRYPQPGQAKTRLIPALGAAGAADLHRQMVEQTLAQVRRLQVNLQVSLQAEPEPLSVEIWFAGTAAEASQMQDWLGDTWCYRVQQGEDLGERLQAANRAAFSAGMQQVITIGTDCPDLTAEILQQAFRLLDQQDLVLGPAQDGGYYLIGLRSYQPELFGQISWSSELVLRQTAEIAANLKLAIGYLEMLADVDRPEDLAIWEASRGAAELKPAPKPVPKPAISVIIPVLNEASAIEQLIGSLQASPEVAAEGLVEVIIVDGGSSDQTVALASAMGVRVIEASQGRAAQMNAAAEVATGEVLLFLHADSRLPNHFTAFVQQALAQPDTIAGAFELQIADPDASLRWVERGVNWRSRWLQLPYGDQAIFLKAEVFRQLGGFAALPIMEDFELVRRLQRRGKIAIVPAAVLTSARRWQKLGVLKTTLINQLVIAAYFLGVSPEQLAHWYRSVPPSNLPSNLPSNPSSKNRSKKNRR